ncbi:hypothetical protein BB559_001421 [Furculomyces boomerangus]|uniref:Uncharacterized protein n=1 Tax=Furculomyces boomerangus TaxID=61424 RepID=A0A2T9Z235_9FUNG|nr:hypothetical protein BB559_001421 [Furculomyces boomerangus]
MMGKQSFGRFDIKEGIDSFKSNFSKVHQPIELLKSKIDSKVPIASIKFGYPQGDTILVNMADGSRYILDSFRGKILLYLQPNASGNDNEAKDIFEFSKYSGQNTCFTPNGAYVVSGNNNGSVEMWDIETPLRKMNCFDCKFMESGQDEGYLYYEKDPDRIPRVVPLTQYWQGHLRSPIYALGVNPKYHMGVSSGNDTNCKNLYQTQVLEFLFGWGYNPYNPFLYKKDIRI